jgi:hypothetical protein
MTQFDGLKQSDSTLGGSSSVVGEGFNALPAAEGGRVALMPDDQECAEFQARMAERIAAGEDLASYPHMQTCERCRGLVSDLEHIAQVARLLMPTEEEPQTDLWAKIQLAIERGEA